MTNPALGSDVFALFSAIDMSGNVPLALDELSPKAYELYDEIAIDNATFTTLEVDARLNNLRDGSENVDTSGMSGSNDNTVVSWTKESDGKESKGNPGRGAG